VNNHTAEQALKDAGWEDTGCIGPYVWTNDDQDFYTLEQAMEIAGLTKNTEAE
jgi:hypothetical protein